MRDRVKWNTYFREAEVETKRRKKGKQVKKGKSHWKGYWQKVQMRAKNEIYMLMDYYKFHNDTYYFEC